MSGDAALDKFAALDPTEIALLLDFDGTLVDIAPTPDAVHVPDDLCGSLARLLARTGGALALVSGRPILVLDRLFSPLKFPIVGGHGAEMRVRDAAINMVAPLPGPLRQELGRAAACDPGILVEDKRYSVALHYRNAPAQAERLRDHIDAVLATFGDETIDVLPGKALYEVKRPGASKGEAVRRLMTYAPFKGRKPVFVGDDVTDASVFAILPDLDGIGFSVDVEFDNSAGVFRSPADVRRALQQLADA